MKNKFTTVEITMMAVFAAILCVSAYLSIPTPLPNAAHITSAIQRSSLLYG